MAGLVSSMFLPISLNAYLGHSRKLEYQELFDTYKDLLVLVCVSRIPQKF